MHTPVGVFALNSVRTLPPMADHLRDTLVYRRWILDICRRRNLTPSELAKQAGVSTSTLTRLVYDEEFSGTLSGRTIAKIARAARVRPPELYDAANVLDHAEPDAVPVASEEEAAKETEGAMLEYHQITSTALQLAGYLPGDYIQVDKSVAPRPGDVVLAIKASDGTRQTLVRIFQPPYLIAATADPSPPPPELVDPRIQIVGVVVKAWRHRV